MYYADYYFLCWFTCSFHNWFPDFLLKQTHYGRAETQSVSAVKALYEELGLFAHYKQFEQRAFAELRAQIAALPERMEALGLSREERVATLLVPVLNAFADKLVGRKL